MGESRPSSGAVRTGGVGWDRPDRVRGAHGRDGAASTRLGLNFAPQKFPDSIERTLPDLATVHPADDGIRTAPKPLLQNESALFLELSLVDLAPGETLFQNLHGA
jgi:hypothetical protein